MLLNPDAPKQAQEVVFSRKKTLLTITTSTSITCLKISEHINEKIKKAVKSISVIKKLNVTLPRSSLLIIYKSFIRPHLDYGDVIYDQPNNNRLSEKIESIQYKAA